MFHFMYLYICLIRFMLNSLLGITLCIFSSWDTSWQDTARLRLFFPLFFIFLYVGFWMFGFFFLWLAGKCVNRDLSAKGWPFLFLFLSVLPLLFIPFCLYYNFISYFVCVFSFSSCISLVNCGFLWAIIFEGVGTEGTSPKQWHPPISIPVVPRSCLCWLETAGTAPSRDTGPMRR